MEWSSFDETAGKFESWMDDQRKRISGSDQADSSGLEAKREALKELQSLKHSSDVKQSVMDSLKQNASHLNVKDAMERLGDLEDKFESVKSEIDAKLSSVHVSIKAQEEVDEKVAKVKEQIQHWQAVLDRELNLGYGSYGGSSLNQCGALLDEFHETILPEVDQTFEHISKAEDSTVEDLSRDWAKLKDDFDAISHKITSQTELYAKFQDEIAIFQGFLSKLSQSVGQLETLALSSDDKKDNASKLKVELEEISVKMKLLEAFKSNENYSGFLEEEAQAVTTLEQSMSSLNEETENKLDKLEKSLDLHDKFVQDFKSVQDWALASLDAVKTISDLSTAGMKELQEQKDEMDSLEEELVAKTRDYNGALEMGEALRDHLTLEEQSAVKNDLNRLRSDWKQLEEKVASVSTTMDASLQQFAEFTCLQEKLTRWLREIEYAMQEHTKLRPTLEEKKGQLESHQTMHRDITSRNSLVHSVCSKAEAIMASTGSSSLNEYVTSIRKLFKNIEVKSQDLTDKLNLCIVDHSNYNDLLDTFKSFSGAQMDLVSKCVDLHGEKASLVDKLEIVGQLKVNLDEGGLQLATLEKQAEVVKASTSTNGFKYLEGDLKEARNSWQAHSALVEDLDMNLEKMLRRWEQYERELCAHSQWIDQYMGLRWDRSPIQTTDDLSELARTCTHCCREITAYQREIEEFSALGNQLVRTSGDSSSAGAAAGMKSVQNSVSSIQKKFEALRDEFSKDSEEFERLTCQLKVVDAKTSEATDFLNSLARKMEECSDVTALFDHLNVEEGSVPPVLNAALRESEKLAEMNGDVRSMDVFGVVDSLQGRWEGLHDDILRLQTDAKAKQAEMQERKAKVQKLSNWVNGHEVNCDDLKMQSTNELESYLNSLKAQLSELLSKLDELRDLQSSFEAEEAADSVGLVKNLISQMLEVKSELTSRIQTAESWSAKANKYNSIKTTYVSSMTSTRERFTSLVAKKERSHDELVIGVLNSHCDQLDELIQEHSDNTHVQEVLMTAEEMADAGVPTAVLLNFKKSIEELAAENERLFRDLQELRNRLRRSLDCLAEHEKRSAALAKWLKEHETMVNNFKHAGNFDDKFKQSNTFKIVCEAAVTWEEKFTADYNTLITDMANHFGPEKFEKWEKRHSLSERLSQARTVLTKIREVTASSQESLELHQQFDERLGKLEAEFKVIHVIIDSDDFRESEEQVNVRRERMDSDLRDLQEFVKKLAVLTSPAGFEMLLKRVNESSSESSKVMFNLTARIRREKVEKTGEFTDWLNDQERHLSSKSQECLDCRDTASMAEKTSRLEEFLSALKCFEHGDVANELTLNAASKVVSRYNEILANCKSKLQDFEAHVLLHCDFDALADEASLAVSNAVNVMSSVNQEPSPDNIMTNYEKLLRIDLKAVSEQMSLLDEMGQKLIPEPYTRESSELGIKLSGLVDSFQSLSSSVTSQLQSMEKTVEEMKSFEVAKKKFQEWIHETSIQLGFFSQKSTLDCKLKYQHDLKSLQSLALEKEVELSEIENMPAAAGMSEVSWEYVLLN